VCYTSTRRELSTIDLSFNGFSVRGFHIPCEIISTHDFQGVATFLCPFGYKLAGPEFLTCGSEGRWSGTVPQCKGINSSLNNDIFIT